MKTKIGLVGTMLLGFVIAGCSDGDEPTSSSKANVRVIHASYDGPSVDVSIDGVEAIKVLPYGKSSGYAAIDSGSRAIAVTPSTGGDALISATLDFAPNTDTTVYAVNMASSIEAIVSTDARAAISDKAKIRFIHAAPDAPAVDIKLDSGDGAAVFSNATFKNITAYAEVDAGSYNFVVTPAGSSDVVVAFEGQALEAGQVYTVMAMGTLDADDIYEFKARVFVDNDAGTASLDLKPKAAEPMMANVRVVHASYDAPAVDVLLDGAAAISDLAYPETSGYASVEAATYNVQVVPAAGGNAVIEANLPLEAGKDYTVFALNGVANIEALVTEDARAAADGKAKFRFLHASPDAPAVDIKVGAGDGPAVVENASFKDLTAYASVDAGSYSFVVTAAGDNNAVVTFAPIALEAGKVYTIMALGTLNADDEYDFRVRALVDNGAGNATADLTPAQAAQASVLVVHASPDAPGVDLLVNDAQVNNDPLTFPNNTGYLPLDAGTYNVKVAASGGGPTVINADLALEPGKSYTVFAADTLDNIAPLVLEDDLAAPAAGKAHVRFVHLSPDAPAVDILPAGGMTPLFANKAFKEHTAFTPLDAGTYDLDVNVAGTSTTALSVTGLTLEAGKIYTVFANGLLAEGATNPLNASVIQHN